MCVPPGEKMSANHAVKIAMKLSLHDAKPHDSHYQAPLIAEVTSEKRLLVR
jgi:hypothetical protein